MVSWNIAHLARLVAAQEGVKTIIFTGSFTHNNTLAQKHFAHAFRYRTAPPTPPSLHAVLFAAAAVQCRSGAALTLVLEGTGAPGSRPRSSCATRATSG